MSDIFQIYIIGMIVTGYIIHLNEKHSKIKDNATYTASRPKENDKK